MDHPLGGATGFWIAAAASLAVASGSCATASKSMARDRLSDARCRRPCPGLACAGGRARGLLAQAAVPVLNQCFGQQSFVQLVAACIKLPCRNCRPDGTARLIAMQAVSEATTAQMVGHIR